MNTKFKLSALASVLLLLSGMTEGTQLPPQNELEFQKECEVLLQRRVANSINQVKELSAELIHIRNQLAAKEDKITNLKLQVYNSNMVNLQSESDKFDLELQKSKNLDTRKEQFAATRAKYESYIKELGEEKTRLCNAIAEANTMIAAKEAEYLDIQHTLDGLQDSHLDLEQQFSHLKAELRANGINPTTL